ncbi:MAG: hypothetical protein ACI4GZ_01945 [Ruminococcus sp.]
MKKTLVAFLLIVFSALLLIGCSENNDVRETTSPQTYATENLATETVQQETTEADPKNNNSAMLSVLRESTLSDGYDLGVAFIGYVEMVGDVDYLRSYLIDSAAATRFPFLADCEPVVYEGQELYAFVPSTEDASITVCRSGMTENGEYENYYNEVIYQGKPGEVVVLRCNVSEIYSNVLVSVTDGAENTEYHPMLSLENGHLALENGIYDLSVYEAVG